MWKLATYVTCVVILFPNAYGYVDYTSYILSRLTEHINQVNHLLKMIYKQPFHQGPINGGPFGIDVSQHDYMYNHVIRLTIAALKNAYRLIGKVRNGRPSSSSSIYPEMLTFDNNIRPINYHTNRVMGYKQSGRRSAKKGDWSNSFYGALANAFKSFLVENPDVRGQLGEDFNADTYINPPDPPENN